MKGPSAGERLRRATGLVGEILITCGVVVGLFALYTLFWTGVETANAQDSLAAEFEAQNDGDAVPPTTDSADQSEERPEEDDGDASDTTDAAPAPLPGDAYARMTIPRLGESWSWIVVEGVDLDVLTRGPGHYPDSVDPGEVGNFAVAGHRATYGEPFAYVDLLEPGDAIDVERDGTMFRYAVTESFITDPGNTGVLLPVPGEPSAVATEPLLTLTTCHPRWGSEERLIVHARLVSAQNVEVA